MLQVPHLWEAITQIGYWVSTLIGTRILRSDDFENIHNLCRRSLEATGVRLNMDCCLIFLAGTRIGQLVAEGASMQDVNVSLDDMFQKPHMHAPLKAYWSSNPPLQELSAARQTVDHLKDLQIGSFLSLGLLQEFDLVLEDLKDVQPRT